MSLEGMFYGHMAQLMSYHHPTVDRKATWQNDVESSRETKEKHKSGGEEMYRTGFREKTWNKQKDVTKERLRGSNIQWSSDYWHVTNTHTRE